MTGDDPAEFDPPLYEIIDPDALDRLFRGRTDDHSGPRGGVEFTMAGCRVVVRSTGAVSVQRIHADAGTSVAAASPSPEQPSPD